MTIQSPQVALAPDRRPDGHDHLTVLGAVSMHCSHKKATNLAKYEKFIELAAERGTQFLVFPEVSLQGYIRTNQDLPVQEQLQFYQQAAETVPGPSTDRLCALALRHNMILQVGMAELDEAGRVRNAAVVLDGSGVLGKYYKIHSEAEFPFYHWGDQVVVLQTAIGKVAPIICADLAFPENQQVAMVKGAQILSMTTAFPMTGTDPETDENGYLYDAMGIATALSTQCWLIQSNQVFRPPQAITTYYGHSRIISPRGRIVAELGFEEGLVTAAVDLKGEIAAYKRVHDLVRKRRPDTYQALLQPNGNDLEGVKALRAMGEAGYRWR